MTEQVAIEQTYKHGKHPNSLANLQPFPPGQSGCPGGQRTGGAYISEWRNELLLENDNGTPRYTQRDLEKLLLDDAAPLAKKIAAVLILNCLKTGANFILGKGGELLPARMDTEPGRERERLMDRTEGKPQQHVKVTQQAPTLDSLEAEFSAMCDQDPTFLGRISAVFANVADADADVTALPSAIDTTAVVVPAD